MTKADIIGKITEAVGLTKIETEAVINGFIVVINEALKNGQEVEIRGLGSFRIIEREPRLARNPKTGEMIQLPKRRVPQFRPSKDLKKAVNETK
ncbi:HU family DNA-binding protein [bacterium]|nr:HU family DNA-binding protein [bacterium]NUM82196.1 HU family DNA-binding protein [bacterium]